MSNRVFFLVFVLFISLGGFFGFHLSKLENLETFKVLNVIGLFYDIVGLIILSEMLSGSERFQKIIADTVSGLFIWGHAGISIGLALAGLLLPHVAGDYPSAMLTVGIGTSIFFWMMVPSFVVEDVVFVPKTKRFQSPESRSRFFGGFLLITGLFIQLIAALQELRV